MLPTASGVFTDECRIAVLWGEKDEGPSTDVGARA
jgi:hypothetical protein